MILSIIDTYKLIKNTYIIYFLKIGVDFLNKKIRWIIIPFIIFFTVSLSYATISRLLENNFNLLFRDWLVTLVIITCIVCILIIEIFIIINLNKIIRKKLSIHEIWKDIIQTIIFGLIFFANFYALLFCLFIIAMGYQEVGVEIHKGEKYLVTDTGWTTPAHIYNYHPYKNLFVYYQDVKYSGEVKWEDYSPVKIDEAKESNPTPSTVEEKTDNITEDEPIIIIPNNVEYVQKIDDNLNYGFYLINHGMHQYLYAFVNSKDEGSSWDIIHTFPATSEIYYGKFLDKDLGFVNFGSSEGLSLFISTDSGSTWENILIDLPIGNTGMLYVQDIKKTGEEIELTLGLPSWSNSNETIKYISLDKGRSWQLK